MHHLYPGALPRHPRTAQQAAERADVIAQIRPAGWGGAQCAGAGETGAERDRDPAGRQGGQRRCGRGVDHRVAQGRYEHAGTQADSGGAFGRQREHHPHVGAFVRCVEQPGPVIAEFFGDRDMRGGMQRGGELGGDLQRADVIAHIRPCGWYGAQCAGACETGAERDRDPARRQRGQRRCGRGVDHRVAQGRYEHAGTQADSGGAFGRQREHHPHIGAFVRCVEQPGPVVAELFGNRDVRRGVQLVVCPAIS